jgi:hypothetical protein
MDAGMNVSVDECTRFVGECAQVLGEVLREVVGEEELKILQGEA